MSTKTFLVDLKKEKRKRTHSALSDFLLHSMEETLVAHQTCLLFLNRRGHSSALICTSCGATLSCEHCDTSMTYHNTKGGFYMCHSCSIIKPALKTCPSCKKDSIENIGLGTQRIQEELHTLFPGKVIARADSDTLRTTRLQEEFFEQLQSGKIDIVIGTQIIAKGIDTGHIGLVGVINADIGMSIPDFRTGERLYQLIRQVLGRTGRRKGEHRVIIQTYQPENPILALAIEGDYDGFANIALQERALFGYPPLGSIVKIICSHADQQRANKISKDLTTKLTLLAKEQKITLDIMTSPAFVHKRFKKYRHNIIIRGKNPRALLESVSIPAGCVVDVDPQSIL